MPTRPAIAALGFKNIYVVHPDHTEVIKRRVYRTSQGFHIEDENGEPFAIDRIIEPRDVNGHFVEFSINTAPIRKANA